MLTRLRESRERPLTVLEGGELLALARGVSDKTESYSEAVAAYGTWGRFCEAAAQLPASPCRSLESTCLQKRSLDEITRVARPPRQAGGEE
jgi:hypothetical protein